MAKFRLAATPTFERDFKQLHPPIERRVLDRLHWLADHPDQAGAPMKHLPPDLKGLHKFRIGDYRVLFWGIIELKRLPCTARNIDALCKNDSNNMRFPEEPAAFANLPSGISAETGNSKLFCAEKYFKNTHRGRFASEIHVYQKTQRGGGSSSVTRLVP